MCVSASHGPASAALSPPSTHLERTSNASRTHLAGEQRRATLAHHTSVPGLHAERRLPPAVRVPLQLSWVAAAVRAPVKRDAYCRVATPARMQPPPRRPNAAPLPPHPLLRPHPSLATPEWPAVPPAFRSHLAARCPAAWWAALGPQSQGPAAISRVSTNRKLFSPVESAEGALLNPNFSLKEWVARYW